MVPVSFEYGRWTSVSCAFSTWPHTAMPLSEGDYALQNYALQRHIKVTSLKHLVKCQESRPSSLSKDYAMLPHCQGNGQGYVEHFFLFAKYTKYTNTDHRYDYDGVQDKTAHLKCCAKDHTFIAYFSDLPTHLSCCVAANPDQLATVKTACARSSSTCLWAPNKKNERKNKACEKTCLTQYVLQYHIKTNFFLQKNV